MRFHFHDIVLWLKNGKKRLLHFEPDKVNVITGESATGKTAVLEIIDYCLFSSEPRISESIINESTEWYGITFFINGKEYTIARRRIDKGQPSAAYYFSSTGEIPDAPTHNNDEKSIKSLIETEFSIDSNAAIPFGGIHLRLGSKVSLRFFLLFNTVSQDIITHSEVFFDKQDNPRYREALERVLDLALGIDTIENKLLKEKRAKLEADIAVLSRKQAEISRRSIAFESELNQAIRQAKEFGVVSEAANRSDAIQEIRRAIAELNSGTPVEVSNSAEKIHNEKNLLQRKIRNLKRFQKEYENHKRVSKGTLDSLKPIDFLIRAKGEMIKTSIFDELVTSLSKDLHEIKLATAAKTPIDRQVNDLVTEYKKRIIELDAALEAVPLDIKTFDVERRKSAFLGEMGAKLNLYLKSEGTGQDLYDASIKRLQANLDGIRITDTKEKRELTIKLLEEIILDHMAIAGPALENYQKFLPVFDYSRKRLHLRKPKTAHVERVGSSSNHMFLHILLFLGLHDVISKNKSPFVPPFLIIDQPSRPYYGDGKNQKRDMDHSDEYKITAAFELLNTFIEERRKDQLGFQMIVFEHIPKRIWIDKELKNVHLVEEFIDGNGLIPADAIANE